MKQRLKWLIPLMLIVIGLAGAFLLVKYKRVARPVPRERALPVVRVAQVKLQNYRLIVKSQGTVTPQMEYPIISEVSGRVSELSPAFSDGGYFKKGDILLKVDPRDYELASIRATSELARARLILTREQAEVKIAQEEWDRFKFGEEPSPLLLRKPQLAEAEAAIASANALLEQARRDLERCVIKAPFEGRVRDENIETGQFLVKGSPVGTIYSIEIAEIRLPIPMEQLPFLSLDLVGNKPVVPLDVKMVANIGGTTFEWPGKIVRSEGAINPRTRTINVIAQVKEPYKVKGEGSPPLTVGLFVEAEIRGKELREVAVIPREAVRGENKVLIIDGEALHFREVTIVRATENEVVVSAGLKDGELICVSPLDAVIEGMRVKVKETLAGQVSSNSVSRSRP